MRGKAGYSVILLVVLSFSLFSCSVYQGPVLAVNTASAAPSGTVSAAPWPSDSPIPSPSPSFQATAAPSATLAPTPTPSADPWAQTFTDGGAYIKVPDWDKGPWIYKDGTLSVDIERRTFSGTSYFRAEIYVRGGTLPFGGFAYNDQKAGHRALPYLIARQNQAVFAITGDYIKNNKSIAGIMIRQSIVFANTSKKQSLAIMPDGNLKIIDPGQTDAQKLLAMGVKDVFSFGPVLVDNGKINTDGIRKATNIGGASITNWRTAIGQISAGHYIAVVNPVGLTLTQVAQIFVDNGCTLAYNLDGGHSTSIVFMGEQLYKQAPGDDKGQQRALSDLLMIGVNPAVPAPAAPVYCNGLGFKTKYRPKPTAGPLN
jgi:exopolysaccharide biosynthesis protein